MSHERSVFRRALELSLLLHLLLLFVVAPRIARVWPLGGEAASTVIPLPRPGEEEPLRFELVELANDREETPPDEPEVPLSDLDRRAHGGEGESAERPKVVGTTPQIVEAEGARSLGRGAPPLLPGPDTRPVPAPEEPVPSPEERPAEERHDQQQREGAGEIEPESSAPKPTLRLPPPGSWALPPAEGGLLERPDRGGGEVDEGGLSFDTKWYDWGPYAKAMLRKIRRNWRIPEIARLGVAGVVKIRFLIQRDGAVVGLEIVDESGKPPMDFAARDAIAFSSPFDPLPSDLTGVEQEGVTITFFYNMHPPDWDGD